MIWHNSNEIPVHEKECLIYSTRRGWNIGKYMRRSDGDKWDVYGYFTPAERKEILKWAYIADLDDIT